MSPEGFGVEGASPTLLAALLDRLSSLLERAEGDSALAPGLPPGEVSERLFADGIAVEEELVVWWSWRNGLANGMLRRYRNTPLSLEEALAARAFDERQGFRSLTSPAWIPVSGQLSDALMVSTAPKAPGGPAVRRNDLETPVQPLLEAYRQVVSLCVPVTMWITAIEQGWEVFDPSTRSWRIPDIENLPLEWRLSNVC